MVDMLIVIQESGEFIDNIKIVERVIILKIIITDKIIFEINFGQPLSNLYELARKIRKDKGCNNKKNIKRNGLFKEKDMAIILQIKKIIAVIVEVIDSFFILII